MALHLIATALHLGEAAVGIATGNSAQCLGGLVKSAASIIPGGSLVASAVLGHVTDLSTGQAELTDAHMNMAAHSAHNALNSVSDAIDAMGNGDGVADIGDIADFIGGIFDSF